MNNSLHVADTLYRLFYYSVLMKGIKVYHYALLYNYCSIREQAVHAKMHIPLDVITIRCSPSSACFFILPTLLHCGHLRYCLIGQYLSTV